LILFLIFIPLAPGFGSGEAEAIRHARWALERGHPDEALRRLERLADKTDDPGLVAYNRGVIRAALGEYRPAEIDFTRALADAAIPPWRRALAQSNRGICLLRHGSTAKQFRMAIDDFEKTLDAQPDDPALLADTRYHLELAKLKWMEARTREAKPPSPSEFANDPPRERPAPEQEQNRLGSEDDAPRPGRPATATSGMTTARGDARPTDVRTAGQGTLSPLPDSENVVWRTVEDTRAYLRKASERLTAERRANAKLLAGPDRKGVRDW
jgi:tetratricopeptide (TPR) repeat protein